MGCGELRAAGCAFRLKTALVRLQQHDRADEIQERAIELEQRLKARARVDYYKVLGVARSASSKEVKKAYHHLAMKYR